MFTVPLKEPFFNFFNGADLAFHSLKLPTTAALFASFAATVNVTLQIGLFFLKLFFNCHIFVD